MAVTVIPAPMGPPRFTSTRAGTGARFLTAPMPMPTPHAQRFAHAQQLVREIAAENRRQQFAAGMCRNDSLTDEQKRVNCHEQLNHIDDLSTKFEGLTASLRRQATGTTQRVALQKLCDTFQRTVQTLRHQPEAELIDMSRRVRTGARNQRLQRLRQPVVTHESVSSAYTTDVSDVSDSDDELIVNATRPSSQQHSPQSMACDSVLLSNILGVPVSEASSGSTKVSATSVPPVDSFLVNNCAPFSNDVPYINIAADSMAGSSTLGATEDMNNLCGVSAKATHDYPNAWNHHEVAHDLPSYEYSLVYPEVNDAQIVALRGKTSGYSAITQTNVAASEDSFYSPISAITDVDNLVGGDAPFTPVSVSSYESASTIPTPQLQVLLGMAQIVTPTPAVVELPTVPVDTPGRAIAPAPIPAYRSPVALGQNQTRALAHWLTVHVIGRLAHAEAARPNAAASEEQWSFSGVLDQSIKRNSDAGLYRPEFEFPMQASTPPRAHRDRSKVPADPYHVLRSHNMAMGIIKPDTGLVNFVTNLVLQKMLPAEVIIAAAWFIDALPIHEIDGLKGHALRQSMSSYGSAEQFPVERRLIMMGLLAADAGISDEPWVASSWAIATDIPKAQACALERLALGALGHAVLISPQAWVDHCASVYANLAKSGFEPEVTWALLDVANSVVRTARTVHDEGQAGQTQFEQLHHKLSDSAAIQIVQSLQIGIDTSAMPGAPDLASTSSEYYHSNQENVDITNVDMDIDEDFVEFDGAAPFPAPVRAAPRSLDFVDSMLETDEEHTEFDGAAPFPRPLPLSQRYRASRFGHGPVLPAPVNPPTPFQGDHYDDNESFVEYDGAAPFPVPGKAEPGHPTWCAQPEDAFERFSHDNTRGLFAFEANHLPSPRFRTQQVLLKRWRNGAPDMGPVSNMQPYNDSLPSQAGRFSAAPFFAPPSHGVTDYTHAQQQLYGARNWDWPAWPIPAADPAFHPAPFASCPPTTSSAGSAQQLATPGDNMDRVLKWQANVWNSSEPPRSAATVPDLESWSWSNSNQYPVSEKQLHGQWVDPGLAAAVGIHPAGLAVPMGAWPARHTCASQ